MNKYQVQYENECHLLGCLLTDNSLLDECSLAPKHFLDEQNKALYQLLTDMRENGEQANIITISQLGDSLLARIGGTERLVYLKGSIPSLNAFELYHKAIKDFQVCEEAIAIANHYADKARERSRMQDLQEFLSEITRLEVSTAKANETFENLLALRQEDHRNSPSTGLSGVNSGFMNINKLTDGWQPSDLIIIAARPSMGKTALVLNSLLEGSKKDNLFGTFFSIEMAKAQVVDRLIAMEARLNLGKMRNPNKTFEPNDWTLYHKALDKLKGLPLDIRDEYTLPSIRAALKKNMKERPDRKHVAAIDFLTLIKHTNPSGNVHVDVTDIIQDLKQLGKDLNIPIIVLAQLNRGVEQRQDKRPVMSDIRESGSIEQIADLIMFLYRDEYYNPQTDQAGITELIIAKHRNGPTGTVKLKFQKTTNIFSDYIL